MNRYAFLAKQRAVVLANALLNEEGRLHNLEQIQVEYPILHGGYNDGDIVLHFEKVIKFLRNSLELRELLHSFTLPLHDRKIEEMLAVTLGVEEKLTNRHIVWGALSALLCPLRQHVGSCFATAPAILIHEEQPLSFLRDLRDLCTKGRITRTFGGVEYTVPISPSPGLGDLKKTFQAEHPGAKKLGLANGKGRSYLSVLKEHFPEGKREKAMWVFVAQTDHLLLKIWEYTLASFVDVKTEFSRWNLFSSLGLHPEEKGGIGEIIYRHLEEELKEANQKLQHYQTEYEIAFDQVKMTEALLRNVTTEADGRRLRAEHTAKAYHLRACEEMRNTMNEKAQNIAQFFPFLLEQIVEKFEEHFQEVYDAEMQEMPATPYDDAPAGFRLLYKHGRRHVGSWTFIHNAEEYIQALKQFFFSIEEPLKDACPWEGGKEEISKLITAIVFHVVTEEFITSSFYRMAKAHQVPLQKIPLEQMEKKPWAYTSGGTIPTLLKTYFRREGSLSEEARWIESPTDLLIFLLDTLKSLPPRITDSFLRDPSKRMLMTSPTHAFSLLPGQELFRQGWEDPGFTYTWVRDQIIQPRLDFYHDLEPYEQLLLLQELGYPFPATSSLSIFSFRSKLPPDPTIDAKLYELLPILMPEQMEKIFNELGIKEKPPASPTFRRHFHDLAISFLTPIANSDLHLEVAQLFERKKLSPPRPVLFADTNWSKFYFSFLVNPSTRELELWRMDKIGLTGAPMREWEPFLNGTIRQNWGVYLRPYEYTF